MQIYVFPLEIMKESLIFVLVITFYNNHLTKRRHVMDIKIKATQVETSDALEAYITKKVARLERKLEGVEQVQVQLKLVKKQAANNKVVVITLPLWGSTIRVEKTCNTFEEAVDKCVDIVKGQIEKVKDKVRQS